MKRIEIKKLYEDAKIYEGKEVHCAGWVRTIRDSKTFGFIELNDGSCFRNLQVVIAEDLSNFAQTVKLGIGSSLFIKGTVVCTPGAKQPIEVKATEVEILGNSPEEFPLQKKRHGFEYLRTIGHLRPRTNTFNAVFRIRSIVSYAIHRFFQERAFVYVHTPIITGSDCEGAGQMFRVSTLNPEEKPDFSKDFFGKQTNLTVSGQLEGETFCCAFGKIYTFGPTFRAENSNTPRHAAEFWMVEPEIAFADLQDDMDLAEEMIRYIITSVLEQAPDEIRFFSQFIDNQVQNRLEALVQSSFERITYTQAIELLKKADKQFEYPVEWGKDLQTEHERYITEEIYKKPVFVTDYPREIKAFYMRQNPDGKTVAAMDLLVPGVGEIIGGSQREERLEVLIRRIQELQLNPEDYWWYLELRKFGSVPHAGFGLGLERILMYVTGMANIRDVIPFPRTVHNAEF